jgi:hypothetical protein
MLPSAFKVVTRRFHGGRHRDLPGQMEDYVRLHLADGCFDIEGVANVSV